MVARIVSVAVTNVSVGVCHINTVASVSTTDVAHPASETAGVCTQEAGLWLASSAPPRRVGVQTHLDIAVCVYY